MNTLQIVELVRAIETSVADFFNHAARQRLETENRIMSAISDANAANQKRLDDLEAVIRQSIAGQAATVAAQVADAEKADLAGVVAVGERIDALKADFPAAVASVIVPGAL